MSVRILESKDGEKALYDSVTMTAFGPVFYEKDDVENFLEWLHPVDARTLSQPQLADKQAEWQNFMDEEVSDPLSPVYDLPYDPKGGSGILEAGIWIDTHGGEHKFEYLLAYSWVDTVNGLEIDCEKPNLYWASSLEEDINISLQQLPEFKGKQYTINYIKC